MMEATTNKRYFNELKKNPLFFMEQKYESIDNGTEIVDYFYYKSTQAEISAFINEEKIVNEILHLDYVLLVAENEVKDVQEKSSDTVRFSFHIADPQYD